MPPPGGLGDDDGGGGGGPLTLRDVLAHVVRHEVKRFRERQEANRLDRVLSARQIEQGEAKGAIRPEGRDVDQPVDDGEAVATAWQAFEDGLYLVIIDGEEYRQLDQPVSLGPDSRLTFVRLTFLAGA